MNTIGKILVILNFLFALIMAVLLVMHVAVREKWKELYFAQVQVNQAMKVSRDGDQQTRNAIVNDYNAQRAQNETHKQELKDKQVENAAKLVSKDLEVAELQRKLLDSGISLQIALKAKGRLTYEITLLNETIKDREQSINALNAEVKAVKLVAITNENLARARQVQNEAILQQLQEYRVALARKEAGIAAEGAIAKGANARNMPTSAVKGTIEKVDDKDNTLVQISLGTDNGVNKNHTLDVYRIQGEGTYLGMIRILDAHAHFSIGRLVASGNPGTRPQLKQGDVVASYIK